MAQSVANVAAGSPLATGGILYGPKGTALPSDATTTPNAALKAFGYADDKGLEPSGEGAKKKEITAWGGDVIASLTEAKSIRKFRFTLVEVFSVDVLKFVFGAGNVTSVAATSSTGTTISIQDKGDEPADGVFVFEMFYKGKKMRHVAPNASATVLAERPNVDTDVMGYEVEITCLPDANGVRMYRYLVNDDKTG